MPGLAPLNTLGVRIDDADLERVFAPFVVERFAPGDARWAAIVEETRRLARREASRRRWQGWIRRVRRTQRAVERAYTQQWGTTVLEEQLRSRVVVPYEWRGRGMLGYNPGRKAVQQLLLIRALAHLGPKTVLEVGAGNGIGLLLLAARFPEIRFTGIELTRSGVEMAQALCAAPDLPTVLREFAVEPLRDLQAHGRVAVRQANAVALPFADRSVDVVLTTQALEQMEEVRGRALREIARVARRYAVMVEPFRDWNANGWRRDYVVARDYFSAWVADLPAYGLRPVVAVGDIPNKLAVAVGLVIAQVAA